MSPTHQEGHFSSEQSVGFMYTDSGGFTKKDRITHRIPITTPEEIDDEVRGWLRKAYGFDS